MNKVIVMFCALAFARAAYPITATKAYVDVATNATLTAANAYTDSVAGVTPSAVTNIASAVVTNKVAPWAMKGQPQPTGTISDVKTNGVSAVVGGVANITIPQGGGGGGGADTNAVNGLIRSYDTTNLTARLNAKRGIMDLNVYTNVWGNFVYNRNFNFANARGVAYDSANGRWTAHVDYYAQDTVVYAAGNADATNLSFKTTFNIPAFTCDRSTVVNGRLSTAAELTAAIAANEKTGTTNQIMRGELYQPANTWQVKVEEANTANSATYATYSLYTTNANFAGRADSASYADSAGTVAYASFAYSATLAERAPWSGVYETPTTLSGYGITDAYTKTEVDGKISGSDPAFSNAVLAVGFGVSSNDVAVIREMVGTIGDLPIGGGAATLGGLLAAIVASVVWLKTNALRKGLTGGVPDDPNVSTLFTRDDTSTEIEIDGLLKNAELEKSVKVCAQKYGGTQIKQDDQGNFYYEVEE